MVMFCPAGSAIVTANILFFPPTLRALANLRRKLVTPILPASGGGGESGLDHANFRRFMFDSVRNIPAGGG
jgi:hypothetical protein